MPTIYCVSLSDDKGLHYVRSAYSADAGYTSFPQHSSYFMDYASAAQLIVEIERDTGHAHCVTEHNLRDLISA